MPQYKRQRLESQIAAILNNTILTVIENPLVKDGNVTYVKLSDDLGIAKIYLDCLDWTKINQIVNAFISASGVFKTALSKKLTIRKVPKLLFVADTAIDKSLKIEKILSEIKKENS